jgi:hypothetical protein
MALFDVGNPPINSTGFAPVAAPSTASLIAELDSTQLGTVHFATGQSRIVHVYWKVGSDTAVTWQLEVATSTALNAGRIIEYPKTGTGLSAQFLSRYVIEKDERLRARMFSTGANAHASICAEYVT